MTNYSRKPITNHLYTESDVQPMGQTSRHLAAKLKAKAKEEHIPLQQDESILEALTSVDLGENIPPQLYAVIAEMLMFIQEVEKKEDTR
jgi:flagellar biosynthesis protein